MSRIMSGMMSGRVPEMYAEASWDRVRSRAVYEWSMGVLSRAHRRSDESPRQAVAGRGMLLMGPVGTGKSSAAALACREAVRARRTVHWTYVPDLLDHLSDKPGKRQEVIQRSVSADVLVWDDFGVRDPADWEVGYLDQIVERRYANYKPMIVTTNLSRDDLVGDVRLSQIVDRWRQRTACEAIVLSGASMRGEVDA